MARTADVHAGPGGFELTVSPDLEGVESPFGWDFAPKDGGDWQITIRITTRQDGQTAFAVLLTQCDGLVEQRSGLVHTPMIPDVIGDAVADLTRTWAKPITRTEGNAR